MLEGKKIKLKRGTEKKIKLKRLGMLEITIKKRKRDSKQTTYVCEEGKKECK